MDAKQTRQGVLLALAAYFIWGIAPAYFKLIYYVPADEILTHRVIWSFFFMVVLMSICRQWSYLKTLIQTPQKIFMLAVSAVLIGGNWLLFIWAVNNHHMLEASLGYFINPLVNIVLGMIFLGERFRRMQWLAVILAICGVLVQLWTFGSLPIIALGLAFSFAFYGLVRSPFTLHQTRTCPPRLPPPVKPLNQPHVSSYPSGFPLPPQSRPQPSQSAVHRGSGAQSWTSGSWPAVHGPLLSWQSS